MKRIIHISSSGTNVEGGMSRISHHWLQAFRRHGFETKSFDPTTVPLRGHRSFMDLQFCSAVKRELQPDDVLLVHEPLSGAFANLGAPLIIFSHGVEERLRAVAKQFSIETGTWKSPFSYPLWARVRRQARRGLKKANIVLVTNMTDRGFLIKNHYCEGKIIYYRNGVYAGDHMAGNTNETCLLFIGTWIERKGIQLLRQAYQYFRSRPNPPRWRFAGTQLNENKVREYLGASDDDRVEVFPSFHGSAENSIYAGCEILVLPSFMEGQPLVLLEGLNRGLSCVATSADGQLDLIKNGENGLLFPVGDPQAFVDCIERVLKDNKLRNDLSSNARQSMSGRSWETVSDELVLNVTSCIAC